MRTTKGLAASGIAIVVSIGLVPLPASAEPDGPDGSVVRTWTTQALDAVRAAKASDAAAARTYAMVEASVYDTVNGLAPSGMQRTAALVVPQRAEGDAVVAVATAAHDVLVALYPARAGLLDAQLAADVAASTAGDNQLAKGRAWGSRVAAAVLNARSTDAASLPDETLPAGSGPGQYPLAWPGAQWRHLEPFVIQDPAGYVGSGPPALGSVDYEAALQEVKVLGSATPADAAKSASYAFWNLNGGTDQPAGAWLQVAQAVSGDLNLEETARLFALEALAMADTVGPTYQTKWTHRAWRPTHAIQATDSGWKPRGGVGTSPENWSGHSSFSAAAATVLTSFFCDDHRAFTLVSDSTPSAPRGFMRFSDAAAEAGRSRVFGGLHFAFSNEAGLAAGRAVAEEVLGSALLLQRGATHHGSCPM